MAADARVDIETLKVAVDVGPSLRNQTGVGRYAGELAAHVELQGVAVKRFAIALRGPTTPGIARWRIPARAMQGSWRHLGGPSLRRLVGDVDLIHATNFVLPPTRGTPGVVTVHDLSFFRQDLHRALHRLRDQVPWSVARAARVIVPTRAVADEVRERFGAPEDKIAVIHEGVATLFFGAQPLADEALHRYGITRPFMLAAGTLQPRKNFDRLIAAWRAAGGALEGWTLVVAGPAGWGPELPETAGVRLLGWVGDETLPGLIAAADVFCYPSLYEGFGLPPLEAMAAGTPCLVGSYPAAEEVVGDAALLVDPQDVDGIAAGLVRLASDGDLRRDLKLRGRVRAASFSWDATAAATIALYRSLLE